MTVHVEYTGQLRTAAGCGELTVHLEQETTLGGLLARLATDTPALTRHLFLQDGGVQPSLLLVVNGAAVTASQGGEDVILSDGSRVSLMPPVAGG